jgi:hypothetical protein
MARIALVNCGVPNGLRLTLERREEEGLTGIQHVELEPGQNHVDPDFWEAWIAQNGAYAPVVSGALTGQVIDLGDEPEVAPEPEPAPPEPEPVNETEIEATELPAPAAVMSGDSNMHLEDGDHVAVQPDAHAEPEPISTPESELPLDETQRASAPSVQAEDAAAVQGTPLASPADVVEPE